MIVDNDLVVVRNNEREMRCLPKKATWLRERKKEEREKRGRGEESRALQCA